MAQGSFTVFNEFLENMSNNTAAGGIGLKNDSFKIMLVSNATVPTASTATPNSADFTEVTGTNYTAGGEAATITYTESSGTATATLAANVSWTSPGTGGPANIYYGILYSTSHSGTEDAVGFIDMTTDGGTTPLDLDNGDITINSGNLFTIS